MLLPYEDMINAVYNTIIGNDLFNPQAVSGQRLINQLIRTQFVPGPPFPAMTIQLHIDETTFKTLGYHPWKAVVMMIKVWCAYPNDRTTQRIKTDLGITSIMDEWSVMREVMYINSKLLEWAFGDDTEDGLSRRHLGCDKISGVKIGIVKWPRSEFKQKLQQNIKINYVENTVLFDNIQMLES